MNLTTRSMTGILKHLIQIIKDNDLIKKKINPSATDVSCVIGMALYCCLACVSLSILCKSLHHFMFPDFFSHSCDDYSMLCTHSPSKNLLSVSTICLISSGCLER